MKNQYTMITLSQEFYFYDYSSGIRYMRANGKYLILIKQALMRFTIVSKICPKTTEPSEAEKVIEELLSGQKISFQKLLPEFLIQVPLLFHTEFQAKDFIEKGDFSNTSELVIHANEADSQLSKLFGLIEIQMVPA